MAIDKEKLIELLIARTGLEKEKVEEQLLQLISRIKEAAEEGKSFQIEGLGTFNFNDDVLHFSPSDTLETEINHKYAGMRPIELIGAFKEAPPLEEDKEPQPEEEQNRVEPEEQEEEPVYTESEPVSQDGIFGEVEPSLQDQLHEVFGGEEIVESQEPPADSSDLGEELLAATGMEEPSEEEKPKASFVFDDEGFEEQKSGLETPPATPSANGIKEEKKNNDPIGTVLTACVVVLAIGVSGWLIYDLGLFSTSGSVNNQAGFEEDPTVQMATGQPASNVSLEDAMVSDISEPEPSGSVTAGDAPPPPPMPDYGLMGEATSRGNDGYTIVVHSLANKSTSESIKDRLGAEGYRTVLSSAVVNGKVFWRIGLGQFRTIADAQQAVRTLPAQYQDNHFIKRIQ